MLLNTSQTDRACSDAEGGEVVWRAECHSTPRPPMFLPDAMIEWRSQCVHVDKGIQMVIARLSETLCRATLWASEAGRRRLRPQRLLSWLSAGLL